MSNILTKIKQLTEEKPDELNNWFSERYARTEPFFYSSVDIRHSGHKVVPVDTNLFPAGFNLLGPGCIDRAVRAIKQYFKHRLPDANKLLLIPEDHTRNAYYLENIAVLSELLIKSGLEVCLGGFAVSNEPIKVESHYGRKLTIHPLHKDHRQVIADNFVADVVLVNNDLSSGAPELLKDIEQPVIPPVGLGWYQRRKTRHFDAYAEVARNFSQKFDLDPWQISAIFDKCGMINFKERTGLECVAISVERVLTKIQKKYDEYGIKDEPYVFIKANSGTYGMGIITVRSAEEVFEINKKARNKMNVIKEGVVNSEVIIQEGVPTVDKVDGKPAESLIYLIDDTAVGCTYRINENRDAYGNLNAPGMTFQSVCEKDGEAALPNDNLCPAQSLIARLASLAATRECYEMGWEI